jgi:hypothetical protein
MPGGFKFNNQDTYQMATEQAFLGTVEKARNADFWKIIWEVSNGATR